MKNESVKKIAIRFGDNDFHDTFYGVAESMFSMWKHTDYLPKDKSKLAFLINGLSPIMYVGRDNCWKYNGLETANGNETERNEHYTHIKQYLQLTENKILIDEEVDEFVSKTDWDNHETYILDTTLDTNNIYII
jgi:hypothetical protein